MSFIARQVKPPARVASTFKLEQTTTDLLKRYAQFLDSSQEYVVNEVLSTTFRRDKEFQTWLANAEPGGDPNASQARPTPSPARDGESSVSGAPRRR